jgi:KTSC domain
MRSPQKHRAHNFRIVGTIRNEAEELALDWQPLESKLLAATAYDPRRRRLYLRFRNGEVYRYFTFPAEQYQELLDADSHGHYFLGQIRDCFPYERLPRR